MTIDQTDVSQYAPGFKIEIQGSEIAPELAYSVLSLKIDQELDKTNSFTLEIQDAFREGRFKWLEDDLFQIANSVSIKVGYTNKLTKVLQGKIQNVNASFNTGCAPTFSVEGSDNSYDILTTPSETNVFREKRDSDIVKKVAEMAKVDADVTPTPRVQAVKTKQGGKSYMDFLRGLAKENNYKLLLGGRTLHFKEYSYDDSVATLAWGENVIRFEPQLNTTSAVTSVIVRGWDAAGKTRIEGRAKAGDENTQESGKRTASQLALAVFGNVEKVITDRPVRSQADADQIARSELNRASDNLVEATVDTIGEPTLAPGVCIEIKGFGKLFSGKYYIVKATHTLGRDGYKTSLGVRRNAV